MGHSDVLNNLLCAQREDARRRDTACASLGYPALPFYSPRAITTVRAERGGANIVFFQRPAAAQFHRGRKVKWMARSFGSTGGEAERAHFSTGTKGVLSSSLRFARPKARLSVFHPNPGNARVFRVFFPAVRGRIALRLQLPPICLWVVLCPAAIFLCAIYTTCVSRVSFI